MNLKTAMRSSRAISIATRAVVSLAIVALAVAVFFVLVRTGRSTPQLAVSDVLPRVVVFDATRQEVARQWTGYGTVEAGSEADVPARVAATVVSIPDQVKEGNPVQRDQLLIQLDTSDLQRQVEIARASVADLKAQLAQLEVERARMTDQLDLETRQYQVARSELERVQSLMARDAARQSDLDAAERTALSVRSRMVQAQQALESIPPRRDMIQARLAGQESALASALENLRRASVRSPIGGILQSVDVEVGENVVAGQRVARVVNLEQVEIPLRLPASARPDLAVGDPVLVLSTSGDAGQWNARISRISPADDPQSRTVTVYVVVDQPQAAASFGSSGGTERLLAPGTFVSARVTGDHAQSRWVVPRRAVRDERIMVVRDGVLQSLAADTLFALELTLPQTRLPDTQWLVVDAPLADDLQVVLSAPADLTDGQLVNAVPFAGLDKTAATTGAQP